MLSYHHEISKTAREGVEKISSLDLLNLINSMSLESTSCHCRQGM